MMGNADPSMWTLTETRVPNLAASGTPSGAALALDDAAGFTRRALLLGMLAGSLELALSGTTVRAGAINPSETQITLPDAIKWTTWSGAPPRGGEIATLYGGLDQPGLYLVLMKWYPGYMSAPHSYATDRPRWCCPAHGG